MSFKRRKEPESFSTGDELTKKLIGIGFMLSGTPIYNGNIEDTIFAASIAGMAGDFRILSLLVDWLDAHSKQVLADRLFKLANNCFDQRVKAFWKAIGKWKKSDPRFRRFAKLYRRQRIDLLFSGTEFHVRRSGEDVRFENSSLRVPATAGLRHRPEDVMSPSEVAKIHHAYYCRLIIGPTYRADMWAELDLEPELAAAELARRTYGSFATAWEVKRQWEIIHCAAA
jgi:hypothetical protein